MNPFEGYRITSPYGMRIHPIRKVPAFHAGIDLVKAHKADIHAFVEGIVQFAEERSGSGFGGMGIVVAIKDKNGALHCYAHLDSASVKVGQIVNRGQEIGKQGNTGKSAGSHLHYEVRRKASPNNGWHDDPQVRSVDPTKYLIDYYAAEAAKEEEIMIKIEDANKIIKVLSDEYGRAKTQKEKDEMHRLANEVRKASDQKVL